MPNIRLTRDLSIRESELKFELIFSGGPGGQNINKNATAIQLRFDVVSSESLPEAVKHCIQAMHDRRITGKGIIIIKARRFRSVKNNREDALRRLSILIQKASIKLKPRKPTGPTRASKIKRLENKRLQGQRKKQRSRVGPEKID